MRAALFWVVTQRVAVISYRRCGINLSVPSAGVRNPYPENGKDRLSRNVGKVLPPLAA